MKKIFERGYYTLFLKYLIQTMRIFLLLFFIGINTILAETYSQETRLSIQLNDVSVEELFSTIEENSEYIFLYKDNVPINARVSVNVQDETLDKILEKTLKSHDITYHINDRQVIVARGLSKDNKTINLIQQQNKEKISGSIVDSLNEPIIGAHIRVKGTSAATATDINGHFIIETEQGSTLVISYIGFLNQEIIVKDNKPLHIIMKDDMQTLEEVVVVGYGTLEKKQVTSSISSISGDKLVAGVGGASIANAMQGKISGLVISGNASPNSTNTFQLRGIASITAGQSPLIVVDGMPGADLRSLVQEDILSIDVLKDASAGAIYGTRAAAGVILITTKQSENTDGKVKLSYTGEMTFKNAYGKPKMLSPEEYLAHERGKDYGSRIDWWDEALADNSPSQKHIVNIQGGSRYAQIYTTLMYENNKGVLMEDERDDFAGRLNANFKLLDDWLEIKTHVDYRQTNRNNNAPNLQQALRNNPTRSPYDPSSNTGYNVWLTESLDYNVIADSKLYDNKVYSKWFRPDATVKLNILPIPGLSLQQSVAYENLQAETHTFRSQHHRVEQEINRTGMAYLGFNKEERINTEGYASYVNSWDNHFVNAVAGYSYYEENREGFNMANYNFTNDLIKYWDMGEGSYLRSGEADMSSSKGITQRLLAYFARVNYSYKDKYMFAATFRREGSSKFAVNNRWGTFWSLSGGWRISEETFLKETNWINDLKVRVGYGVTGNNNFGSEYAASYLTSSERWIFPDGNWYSTYVKAKSVNPDLKWEEKQEWNIGLDYSLFNNRLYGKFDIYRRKVEDMIYNTKAPTPPMIRGSMYKNLGNMENKGWEFEVGGDIVRSKDWNYSSNINLSSNKTKLLTLFDNQTYYEYARLPDPGTPGNAIRIEEGVEIGSFYMFKYAGVDDGGNFLIYNKDGDVIPASRNVQADKRYIGNYMPKLIVGWNHDLQYKNWQLTVNMRSWLDYDVLNTIDMYYGLQSQSVINLLQSAYTTNKDIKGEKILCDYFLEDGSFLKIDAISLGYTWNLKPHLKLVDKAHFYLTVSNVATFSKYSGMNPEVDITGFQGGIEWFNGLYPQTRSFAFGVKLTL